MYPIGRIAKALTALVTTVTGWVVLVVNSPAGDISSQEWIVLATGISTAVLVFAVPNSYASDPVPKPISNSNPT